MSIYNSVYIVVCVIYRENSLTPLIGLWDCVIVLWMEPEPGPDTSAGPNLITTLLISLKLIHLHQYQRLPLILDADTTTD